MRAAVAAGFEAEYIVDTVWAFRGTPVERDATLGKSLVIVESPAAKTINKSGRISTVKASRARPRSASVISRVDEKNDFKPT